MQRILIFLLCLPLGALSQQSSQTASLVKAEFLHAYTAYFSVAKEKDAYIPSTQKGYNEFYSSFYLTALESYSTLHIMEENELAEKTKEHLLANLNFNQRVNVPTTKFGQRTLGALLSAFEISHDERFLELATDLGNRLLPAFDSPTGLPYRLVNLRGRTTKEKLCTPQQITGLLPELALLSAHTHNPIYFQKAKKAALKLWEYRSKDNLLGSKINIITGKWVNRSVNATAAQSGYWSALLRAYLLTNDKEIQNIYVKGMKALQKHTLVEKSQQAFFRYTRINNLQYNDSSYQYTELDMPAILALSGQVKLAEKNYQYCKAQFDTLIFSPTWKDLKKNKWTDSSFSLYPEQSKALYYLYLYTKDEKYLKDAIRFFEQLKQQCKTKHGYTGLKNVFSKRKNNKMPAHLTSQTFKYLYLIFAESGFKSNKYIFSESGQPLLVNKKK